MITHADRNTEGARLEFETVAVVDGDMILKVTGDNDRVTTWAERVKGTPLSQADVDSIVASLPPDPEEQVNRDIADLKKRVSKLEASLT